MTTATTQEMRPGLRSTDDDGRPYLICSLAGTRFAIDASRVRHIGVAGRVWPLPRQAPPIKGVTKMRDRLVPLVDLRTSLGLPQTQYHAHTCFVEVDISEPAAVAVDSVERVSRLRDVDIRPATAETVGFATDAVRGIAMCGDRLSVLLDIESLILGRQTQPQTASERTDRPLAIERPVSVVPNEQVAADPPVQTDHDTPAEWTEQPPPMAQPIRLQALPRADAQAKRTGLAREGRVVDLLARPVFVGARRVPGFRRGCPRLAAVAVALLSLPDTFKTQDAAALIARLLGKPSEDYRLTHMRYDLGKLRARNLAERIGHSRQYRLTSIGRMVCRTLQRNRTHRSTADYRAA